MTTIIAPPTMSAAPFNDKAEIQKLMEMTVRDLMSSDAVLDEGQKARHQPYVLMLMSLVLNSWNGNRKGVTGDYPYRLNQKTGHVFNNGAPYLGHNIAAIAVDGCGKVIDFDFNHNDVFRSSLEHAEARLMKRIFSLTGLRSDWSLGDRYQSEDEGDKLRFSTTLDEVTIYTSLEPCAQCAGIMALARVKEVVYLQEDDGARRALNVLCKLKPYSAKLQPITAEQCGILYGTVLAEKYENYTKKVSDAAEPPFFTSVGKPEDRSASLSTFLCTDEAMTVYEDGNREFERRADEARKDGYASTSKSGAVLLPGEAFMEAKEFLEYAKRGGHRGTPH